MIFLVGTCVLTIVHKDMNAELGTTKDLRNIQFSVK